MALAELVIPPGMAQFVTVSLACTVNVFVLGLQGFDGTHLPLNGRAWPTARLGKIATRPPLAPLIELVTVTLVSTSLPQLVIVPLKVITPFSPTLGTHCAVIWTHGALTTVFTPCSLVLALGVSFCRMIPMAWAVARTEPSGRTSPALMI